MKNSFWAFKSTCVWTFSLDVLRRTGWVISPLKLTAHIKNSHSCPKPFKKKENLNCDVFLLLIDESIDLVICRSKDVLTSRLNSWMKSESERNPARMNFSLRTGLSTRRNNNIEMSKTHLCVNFRLQKNVHFLDKFWFSKAAGTEFILTDYFEVNKKKRKVNGH